MALETYYYGYLPGNKRSGGFFLFSKASTENTKGQNQFNGYARKVDSHYYY